MATLEVLALALGLVSTVAGGLAWYASMVRKSYAAEREFNHIKNAIAQLSENIKVYVAEIEEQSQDLMEIKLLVNSLNNQVGVLSAKLDCSTGGIARNQ